MKILICIAKVVQKLKGSRFNYNLLGICGSLKHLNPVTLIDRWERYLRVLSTNAKVIPKPNFANKVVFELGCGPLLGWGPLALFLGAKAFIG